MVNFISINIFLKISDNKNQTITRKENYRPVSLHEIDVKPCKKY